MPIGSDTEDMAERILGNLVKNVLLQNNAFKQGMKKFVRRYIFILTEINQTDHAKETGK